MISKDVWFLVSKLGLAKSGHISDAHLLEAQVAKVGVGGITCLL